VHGLLTYDRKVVKAPYERIAQANNGTGRTPENAPIVVVPAILPGNPSARKAQTERSCSEPAHQTPYR
jgi:hypothetical protein